MVKIDIEYYKDRDIDFAYNDGNPFTALNQGAKCCADKHQTYYGAIVKSPQWERWYKSRPQFDIDESVGCGIISDQHLQAFFKFIKEAK